MNEPIKPPRRFTELSEDTRKFISKLDPDDLATLERMISLFRAVQGWCRINRWLVFTLLAVAFAIVQFMDMAIKFVTSIGKAH